MGKRGRPKGSKNKPKIIEGINVSSAQVNTKEVKRQIRLLRKIKKDTPKKTEARHEINEQIRELKNKLIPIYNNDPAKIEIIDKILQKRPEYIRIGVELNKFTIEELNKHYLYIQNRPRII